MYCSKCSESTVAQEYCGALEHFVDQHEDTNDTFLKLTSYSNPGLPHKESGGTVPILCNRKLGTAVPAAVWFLFALKKIKGSHLAPG